MAIYNQILAAMKPITTAAPTTTATPTTTAAAYSGLILIPAEANLANVASGSSYTVSTTAGLARNTTTVKYGTGSVAFPSGQTNYFTTSATITHAADFTLEAWVYPTALPSGQYSLLFSHVASAGQQLFIYNNYTLGFYSGTTGVQNTTTQISLNTWTHVALVRSGSGTNNCTLYINGVNSKQFSYTASIQTDRIGAYGGGGYGMIGYMDNIGISNTARYTGNFTPSNIY